MANNNPQHEMTNATIQRTDVHRPSAINPAEYEFVGIEYMKTHDLGDILTLAEEKKMIRRHRERTGGTYSRHQHGGNCMICGAAAIYTMLFWHQPSNTYIRTGGDCAAKMEMGDVARFRAVKQGVKDAREAMAGKRKAKAYLEDNGLHAVWELYLDNNRHSCEKTYIVLDITRKLVKYGSISEKQTSFLRRLMDQITNRDKMQAKWDAEKVAAANCPEGKIEMELTVLKEEWRDSQYGAQYKGLFKHATGYLVWGTIPSPLGDVNRGDVVRFTATVKASDKDPKFGFYSRPSKAVMVKEAEVVEE
jgi:hypothetical protein